VTKHLQVVLVPALLLIACAEDNGAGEQVLPTVPEDAEAAAHEILGNTLAFHTAVHAVYGRVKGDLEANPSVLRESRTTCCARSLGSTAS
jgi:hypothetical protein